MTMPLHARGRTLVIGTTLSAVCVALCEPHSNRDSFAAVAAVAQHVAAPLIGVPSKRVYLAYNGKTPPADLLRLVAQVSHLKAMPTDWRPDASAEQIPLLDVSRARPMTSESVAVTATTSALGLAVSSCSYTVRLQRGSWQIDHEATQCLVL